MAITAVDYHVFQALARGGGLPSRPRVLELGEAEWNGSPAPLVETIAAIPDPDLRAQMQARYEEVLNGTARTRSWDMAKMFYRLFLDYESICAIDLHGTPAAMQLDLNYPVVLDERFDMVINLGTAEHVFNVAQFFRTCHELAEPGGMMIHTMPFSGWVEHGFYSFNPTFYWDLAAANRYHVVLLIYTEMSPFRMVQLNAREQIIDMAESGELGRNAMLYAVFRKDAAESEFRMPSQQVYGEGLNQRMLAAWHGLR